MNKRIVLISCVSKKLSHLAKVRDLYTSPLFRLNLRYAESLKPDGIYVLSAKHGLLDLEQEVEPYEQTLNAMKSQEIRLWAAKVLRQLSEVSSPEVNEFVFLAGDRYRKYLLPHIKHARIPLQGLRIGEQLSKLKELTS